MERISKILNEEIVEKKIKKEIIISDQKCNCGLVLDNISFRYSDRKNTCLLYTSRQLISDIGHDIRTPLTVVQGYLLTVINDLENSKSKNIEYLKRCFESSVETVSYTHLDVYKRQVLPY